MLKDEYESNGRTLTKMVKIIMFFLLLFCIVTFLGVVTCITREFTCRHTNIEMGIRFTVIVNDTCNKDS